MDFEPQVLQGFLEARLPDLRGPMRIERIGGGQSNPKQPASSLLPSAHAVDREYRVMQAVAPTSLPVPRMVLFHAGRAVEFMDGAAVPAPWELA